MRGPVQHPLLVLAFVSALLSTSTSKAQPGALDPSFQTVQFNNFGVTTIARDLALQSDGKIIVAGHRSDNLQQDCMVWRYNPDGTPDVGFGSGNGYSSFSLGYPHSSAFRAATIQPNGRILLAGWSQPSTNNMNFMLMRLMPNGSKDLAFGTSGIASTALSPSHDEGFALALQPDGKIIVAGSSEGRFALVRHLSSGALDPLFSSDGIQTTAIGTNDRITAVAVLPNGRILAGGSARMGSYHMFALAQYLSNGTLDPDFGNNGKVTTHILAGDDVANAMVVQSDGRILLAGYGSGATDEFVLVRYMPDGSLDNSFGTEGKVHTAIGQSDATATSMALSSAGSILVAGTSETFAYGFDFTLCRYTPDGDLDGAFGHQGIVTTDLNSDDETYYALRVQPDGKILAAGQMTSHYRMVMARYLGGAESGTGVEAKDERRTPLQVSPMPVHDRAVVEFDQVVQGLITMRLCDLSGRMVRHLGIWPIQGQGKHRWEIELTPDIAPGTYILLLEGPTGGNAIPVIKQ